MSITIITPVNKAEQALALAKTPKESKEVEALAAAAKAWAKEQGDFELTFAAALVYILARCKTTELILPTIVHGDHGLQNRGNGADTSVPVLGDYGFNKLQWSRRRKELNAIKRFDSYQDDCIEKRIIPTPNGLVGFFNNPHVAHNSGNDEWYTPQRIIEKARRVMGGIDLDPASSDLANRIIKAKKYYTIEDDGLSLDWFGRVWMNPPYSQPNVKKFCGKLVDEFERGAITEAIVLVNNATETAFFQNMLSVCKAVCFIKGRLKFVDIDGNPSGAPLQGQALLYFGSKSNGENFADEFLDIGVVLWSAE